MVHTLSFSVRHESDRFVDDGLVGHLVNARMLYCVGTRAVTGTHHWKSRGHGLWVRTGGGGRSRGRLPLWGGVRQRARGPPPEHESRGEKLASGQRDPEGQAAGDARRQADICGVPWTSGT